MQFFSRVIILALAGTAFASPLGNLDPTTSVERPVDTNTEIVKPVDIDAEKVRTMEVIHKMEKDLGELNWVPAAGDGKLLTVPTTRWQKYFDIVKKEHKDQRNNKQERALQKRAYRVPGGIASQQAAFDCYRNGEAAYVLDTKFTTDVTAACNSFYYTAGSSPIQIWTGSPNANGIRWVFKFENWGKLSFAWSAYKCGQALRKGGMELCNGAYQIGSGSTRGGWVDIFTPPQSDPSTIGQKALAFTFDPTI